MKITTILKDIFLALASTLLFGGGIGFVGVCIFDARISTMLHISAYIFLLMLAMWFFIDYQEMKSRQSIQQAIREEEDIHHPQSPRHHHLRECRLQSCPAPDETNKHGEVILTLCSNIIPK